MCASQLRAFKSADQAEAQGFSQYEACDNTLTPTPTATPQVTPLPQSFSASLESGNRLSDVDSISAIKLKSGNYRIYTGVSVSSLEGDTLYYAESADGVSFPALTAISGISPGGSETFAYPTPLLLQNGSISVIYVKIRHISSAAVDIYNMLRAVSLDLNSFSNSPDAIFIPSGSSLATTFQPFLLRTSDSSLRLYWVGSSGVKSVTSTDDGENWSEEADISILGTSSSFAPFVSNPAVILVGGAYLMFFSSSSSESATDSLIYLAQSQDGQTFQVFDSAILTPNSDVRYQDPNPVLLPDGRVRLYFIERSGQLDSPNRFVRSAIITN